MSDLTVADDIVDTALQYAGRGWAVLPTFNKAPPRGFARGVWGATTDPATIIRWFERVYPGAEIGIACGPEPVRLSFAERGAIAGRVSGTVDRRGRRERSPGN